MFIVYYILIYFIFLLLNLVGLLYLMLAVCVINEIKFIEVLYNFSESLLESVINFNQYRDKGEILQFWSMLLLPFGFIGWGIILNAMLRQYREEEKEKMLQELKK